MKDLIFRLFMIVSCIAFSFYAGWETHRLYLYYNRTTEYVDINLCREFACDAADNEIEHWLNMYDMQQERLLNCVALNVVYQRIMDKNPACWQDMTPDEVQ